MAASQSDPVPPENVRIERVDGTVTPLELVYVGVDARGVHQWRTAYPVVMFAADRLRIGVMPARTGISVDWIE